MAETVPARPDTAEIAAPQTGAAGIGEMIRHWIENDIGADPRRWQADPAGVRAAQAALADPHARAVLDQRLDAVVAAPLDIEPGGAMRRDRQAADDLAQQMGAIEIDRVCRELLHAVWYGYAVAEAIWEIDGPRVRLADLRVRDPARFRWSVDGTPLLVTREQPRGAPLPPAKFVRLTQPRQHGGQPHGPGAAQWCLWPVWLKRQALRMWAIALEKFGAPTAVGRVSRTAAADEIDEMLGAMQAMAAGTGIVIPEGQSLELLDAARRAGGDYAAFVVAMDSMIADAVLGQRATSEIGPWRGTADVQATVLERLVAADARRLSAALRQSVATWLTAWNHPGSAVPTLRRDTAPPQDLEARARRDEIVARTAGLRPSLAYVVQTYGGEWEPVAEPATAPAPGDDRRLASPTDPPRPDPPPPPATARNAGGNDPRALAAADPDDPVAALAARIRKTVGPLIDRWADRTRDEIASADTLAAARDRLDEALAWTDDPRAHTPEVADAAGALAPALAAAHLARISHTAQDFRFWRGVRSDFGRLSFLGASSFARRLAVWSVRRCFRVVAGKGEGGRFTPRRRIIGRGRCGTRSGTGGSTPWRS